MIGNQDPSSQLIEKIVGGLSMQLLDRVPSGSSIFELIEEIQLGRNEPSRNLEEDIQKGIKGSSPLIEKYKHRRE